jgi:short-subunit dehydrogenase
MTPRWKCALITGASSGIGAAFARALPRSTSLILTGRDREALGALATELALNGRQVRVVVADLVLASGRESVIGAAKDQPIDLLINNAGLGWLGRTVETPEDRLRDMVLVNVLAPVEITRAILPGMLARAREGAGRCGVIVVSSTAAFMPIPYFATYAATKAFLLHFAEAMAEEMTGEPVDILALCPGAAETRFFKRANVGSPVGSVIHDAGRVAREALEAIGHRRVHVVGPTNYLAATASRFLPRRLVTYAAEKVIQRWR